MRSVFPLQSWRTEKQNARADPHLFLCLLKWEEQWTLEKEKWRVTSGKGTALRAQGYFSMPTGLQCLPYLQLNTTLPEETIRRMKSIKIYFNLL